MNYIVKAKSLECSNGICGLVCGVHCASELKCDLWFLACGKL